MMAGSNISSTTTRGARLFEAIQGIRHALKVASTSDHKRHRSTVAAWIYDPWLTIQKFIFSTLDQTQLGQLLFFFPFEK